LIHKQHTWLHKQCYVIGGGLSFHFGIKTKRNVKCNQINEYFIDVPDHLKPLRYEKIDDGCYW
jgi:hypothetical protein